MQNSKKYQTILFDLDGTLIDSMDGVVHSVNHALTAFGMGVDDLNSLRKFVGPPLKQSFMNHCGFDEEKTEEIIKVYRKYYIEKGIYEHTVYPGIPGLLKRLKSLGKTLAVATSKTEFIAKTIMDNLKLSDYFTVITGSNPDGSGAAKAEVLQNCLYSLNISQHEEVVLVGDTRFDIVGAREVGIDSIAVLYGYGTIDDLQRENPTCIVKTVEDLGRLLMA
ncbi:MAG TPA: HAD hydrolase-like protein [Thermoclostridium sp.]|nr:HAD hydrolase-like protein [Clostridiaceae bacterium]HOQ75704.1 HAD hydrolase-like protein [Thermoclostridium sp.]HPU45317.1 HAD hydrolase-like protein [Thermoclostridium sp.]